MRTQQKEKCISVVVSVYNEELSLNKFYDVSSEILKTCKWDYELVFVNDGSSDKSLQILKDISSRDEKVRVINFARNFGHEAAMIAGIDYACGDAIVCMDADLQHPPESIPDIIEKFEDGYEVVSMIRTQNADAGLLKKITSGAFYKVLNVLSPLKFENNSSDFFALARPVADILHQDYREKVRYLRGYVQSIGFNKTTLEFKARSREAGESKYNIRKLIKFSLNTLCSFSDIPLKLGIYTGSIVALCGIVLMIYTIVRKIMFDAPAGYSTIIVALCFMFAVTLFVIGIIGEYISVLFAEVKNRPIYIVKEVISRNEKVEEENEKTD